MNREIRSIFSIKSHFKRLANAVKILCGQNARDDERYRTIQYSIVFTYLSIVLFEIDRWKRRFRQILMDKMAKNTLEKWVLAIYVVDNLTVSLHLKCLKMHELISHSTHTRQEKESLIFGFSIKKFPFSKMAITILRLSLSTQLVT